MVYDGWQPPSSNRFSGKHADTGGGGFLSSAVVERRRIDGDQVVRGSDKKEGNVCVRIISISSSLLRDVGASKWTRTKGLLLMVPAAGALWPGVSNCFR